MAPRGHGKMARHNHARVAERTAVALRAVAFQHGYAMTFARAMQRTEMSDRARANDDNVFTHDLILNRVQQIVH